MIRELSRRLHALPKVQVEVAALSRWGPTGDAIRAAGIEVTALDAKGVSDLWVIRRLATLVRERQFDTVFSFLVHANAIAAAAKPSCEGVRFFQSIQTTQAYPKWHWHVQRFVHHAAEKVIVPSPSVAQVARERAKVPDKKLVVIPNAVEVADFQIPPIDDQMPFPIGFLGRLDPIKLVPDLVAAVAALGDKIHLHIFGDGPDREAVERAIRIHRVTNATLHGPVPRPQEALKQIGLLVLPSASEGMPMVLIEAMAAGVPVLGRDVPGVRDVIEDGRTGVLAKSLGVADLAEAIAKLVEDTPRRRQLAINAKEKVAQRYAWDVVLREYRTVLDLPA